jgi:hypothetical protein
MHFSTKDETISVEAESMDTEKWIYADDCLMNFSVKR